MRGEMSLYRGAESPAASEVSDYDLASDMDDDVPEASLEETWSNFVRRVLLYARYVVYDGDPSRIEMQNLRSACHYTEGLTRKNGIIRECLAHSLRIYARDLRIQPRTYCEWPMLHLSSLTVILHQNCCFSFSQKSFDAHSILLLHWKVFQRIGIWTCPDCSCRAAAS